MYVVCSYISNVCTSVCACLWLYLVGFIELTVVDGRFV